MSFTDSHKKWLFMLFFLMIVVLTTFLFRNFLSALFVGGLMAYFIYPLYTKLLKKVKYKIIAQIILSIVSMVFLLGILSLIIIPLISQSQELYQKSNDYFSEDKLCIFQDSPQCKTLQKVKSFANINDFDSTTKNIFKNFSTTLFKNITNVISQVISFLLFIVVVVFSLFYFLDNGKEIRDTLMSVLPLKTSHKQRILNRLKDTINAVVGGNISTALMQGFFGGLIFFILGIPLSLFWGLLIAIFAFVPAVGPGIIWIPAATILFLQGNFVHGIILVVYSILILGSIDNILKPKLIGDKIKLSSFAIFLGVIGGLQLFGFLGLFFGPIIIALLVTCVEIYKGMNG
jgi:predicted PurR-regulated permease PerM